MAMEKRTRNIIIIVIVGLLLLGAIAWWIYKSIPRDQGGGYVPPSTTTTSQPGLLELASGFIAGGWIKNLFGGGGAKYKCDCNKPGYTQDGKLKESCNEGRIDYQIDCQ